jgi:hypothetical protein
MARYSKSNFVASRLATQFSRSGYRDLALELIIYHSSRGCWVLQCEAQGHRATRFHHRGAPRGPVSAINGAGPFGKCRHGILQVLGTPSVLLQTEYGLSDAQQPHACASSPGPTHCSILDSASRRRVAAASEYFRDQSHLRMRAAHVENRNGPCVLLASLDLGKHRAMQVDAQAIAGADSEFVKHRFDFCQLERVTRCQSAPDKSAPD